ncbi:2-oxoglutarate dehydrogenase E1 component [Verrucomicrobiaceae bacterium N1E253]|uniref:oxoglutarate dehydrogenase (succinyl-transferring) n=1 Tax=Oceaniferula marina TaxID=2748318 RepID=A0A851GCI5_9BACT|nr:2-oxoglutarate dehydrogenase E1 component [Oceaniferula marina]NWK55448.1 2-oxoglutarate dehydrogenase E1 component [Oceaniferula marina]
MKSSVSARFNAELLEQQYDRWCEEPQSVDADWAAFFEGFELGVAQLKKRGEAQANGANGVATTANEAASVPVSTTPAPAAHTANQSPISVDELDEEFLNFRGKVVGLVYAYRALGHTQAHLNPLDQAGQENPDLLLAEHGLYEEDLERLISTRFFRNNERMTLRELYVELNEIYCGFVGFEFMHIHNSEVRNWLRLRIENRPEEQEQLSLDKAAVLKWLLEAQMFEAFLAKKFLGEKRFSLEGGESAIVVLNTILQHCPAHEVQEIEMGMAHRGRLNVLRNFLHKSLTTLLYEFTPNYEPDLVAGDGDVKYHLGYEGVRKLDDGEVRVSLAANPSHLEAVNAVVEGKARARQRIIGDDGTHTDRKKVLPVLLHGDAAFAGQGSVAEVLNLSQLPGYRTGGTIHLIVNNQIGFTTMPEDARSSHYATDVAKMIEAPVIHVNGEELTELVWAAVTAIEFRQKFGRDIVIDMYCYRRQGHNEADQAAFTQPHTYKKINARKPVGDLYKDRLVADGDLSQEQADAVQQAIADKLDEGYERMVKHMDAGDRTIFTGSTAEPQPKFSHDPVPTGISEERLQHIGKSLTTIPDGFNLHPTLAKRFIPRRKEALSSGSNFDWAFAESLAWGSLLMEGTPVRLSGQDVRRGTFSHRHCVFYDSETRERYFPLKHLSEDQERFCVYNSLLSEAAVLGFDYGYSLGCPEMLIMWEGQFGDFANGAQVIIDQFISSAESKWQTPSSFVMLLPHGYEGMGPEHSSARLERFLQLCAEKNIQVANLTTPAQYFHALRRQKVREVRKPLILMTPKSLLSRPEAVSSVDDFTEGSCFQEILPDVVEFEKPNKVDRIVFCSGKVFYDLVQYRKDHDITNTAIIRVEQLYPLNTEMLQLLASQYPKVKHWVWAQEEPWNMGARSFMTPRLQGLFDITLKYAGRKSSSSPAAGSKAMHIREQKKLLEQAFNI